MTEQEIRDNAPSGATHYMIYKNKTIYYRWCKKDGLFRFFVKKKEWFWVDYFLDEILKNIR